MRSKIKRWLLLSILLLSAPVAFAATFVATVEDSQVGFGQTVQLKLMLEGAKATGRIDFSPLAKDFNIYNQQQFSSYTNTNGVARSETGWHVILMPTKVGEFIIPALMIDTDHGLLRTEEIKITVQNIQTNAKSEPLGISLSSSIQKNKAYVNEPVIYTIKIISYKTIANVVLEDIKSNDAIIEKIGEPKQYDQAHGGVRAHIIEINYAVTALKPGKVSIAPATMQGELQVATQPQRAQRFSLFNNIFMDNMFELRPFNLQSEAITLNVQAAPVKTKDWLPLYSLTMSQSWDNPQDIKVGDTITRKIKMTAKGGFSKQLPTVKDFMPQNNVKVYANKPAFTEVFDSNTDTIVSTREEEYSIVVQKDGSLTFPEIKIQWWNLQTKKMQTSTLPAKTIQVLPNTSSTAPGVTLDYSVEDQPQQIEAVIPTASDKPIMLYAIIGILIGIIVTLALGIMFVLLRKRPLKFKLKLNTRKQEEIIVKNIHDFRRFALQHVVKYWHIPANTTFNRLGDALTNNNYIYDLELYSTLAQHINAGIYASANVELDVLLGNWEEFKHTVIKNKRAGAAQENVAEDYSSLNPT